MCVPLSRLKGQRASRGHVTLMHLSPLHASPRHPCGTVFTTGVRLTPRRGALRARERTRQTRACDWEPRQRGQNWLGASEPSPWGPHPPAEFEAPQGPWLVLASPSGDRETSALPLAKELHSRELNTRTHNCPTDARRNGLSALDAQTSGSISGKPRCTPARLPLGAPTGPRCPAVLSSRLQGLQSENPRLPWATATPSSAGPTQGVDVLLPCFSWV